jgi:hypothetical protein
MAGRKLCSKQERPGWRTPHRSHYQEMCRWSKETQRPSGQTWRMDAGTTKMAGRRQAQWCRWQEKEKVSCVRTGVCPRLYASRGLRKRRTCRSPEYRRVVQSGRRTLCSSLEELWPCAAKGQNMGWGWQGACLGSSAHSMLLWRGKAICCPGPLALSLVWRKHVLHGEREKDGHKFIHPTLR